MGNGIDRENLRKSQSIFREGTFSAWMGMRLVDSWETGARVELKIASHHLAVKDVAHGGVISALIDHTFAAAIVGAAGENWKYVTIEMKINYLEPVRKGKVVAECEIIRKGATLGVATVKVYQGRSLVALGVCTCYGKIMKNRGG